MRGATVAQTGRPGGDRFCVRIADTIQITRGGGEE